jgi:hypothetical protein
MADNSAQERSYNDDTFESASPTKSAASPAASPDASPAGSPEASPTRKPAPMDDSVANAKDVTSPTKTVSTPPRSPTPSTPPRSPTPTHSASVNNSAPQSPAAAADSKPADGTAAAAPAAAASPQKDPSPEDEEKHQRAASHEQTSPSKQQHDDGSDPNSQSKIAQRKRLPARHTSAVATVSYPGERHVAVADILDPTKPLVKSTKPLTRPLGPTFVEELTAEERRQQRLRHKAASSERTMAISEQRNNERKYLKAQQEFEREKRLAERAIYHRERVSQWATRLGASPLGVDLVADHERIDEEAFVRQREERRRRALAEKRKRRIKNEIIVKALAEVPLLEEARRQKREMLEEERREKAQRDVQRVEAIQSRKLRDMSLMKEERQSKLDQRLMNA